VINKLFKHIEVNFASELVFKEALEMSGMGTTSFSRYFKNKTEKTFTQYVNEIRIANAQKLLINSDLKISYICFKCGFNNLTYFNRIFKKLNNITPREFRNLYLMAD